MPKLGNPPDVDWQGGWVRGEVRWGEPKAATEWDVVTVREVLPN